MTFTSVTSATACNLGLNASGVAPSHGPRARWDGFPICCKAIAIALLSLSNWNYVPEELGVMCLVPLF